MGYIHCDGMKYGIIPKRNIIDSILLNIPIINRLYTKKIEIQLTNRLDSGAPVCGIFSCVRIYSWQYKLMINFMVPEVFTNVLLNIYNKGDVYEPRACYDKCRELGKDTVYEPGIEYSMCLIVRNQLW